MGNQRNQAAKIPQDRKDRLNALGFVWDVRRHQWEKGFSALKAFHEINGHCRVSYKHIEDDGFKLGLWAGNQRARLHKLSSDQKDRLNALGFVWRVKEKNI